jgi:spore coat polysaccharide biosynthesis protein SpsF
LNLSKNVAVIQARMGSSRFPGKIMKKINDKTVLENLFHQLTYSKLLGKKIIVTTKKNEDDILVEFTKLNNIDIFRGNEIDVLDRYYQCAKKNNIENIVRITSDCPLIDPTIVDKVIEKYNLGNYDYVNNFSKIRCPSGFEVEIFSFECLEKTWKNAKEDEREHVTQYIYKNPNEFKIGSVSTINSFKKLHLSIDTKEDLKLIQIIYEKIESKPILLTEISKIIFSNPSMLTINNSIL